MPVRASEEDKLMGTVARGLGLRIEGISSNDYGGGVGGTAALSGDASCMGSIEAEEVGKGSSSGFLDDAESW